MVHLPVRLQGPRGWVDYVAENISVAGMFVRTDLPRPLRQALALHLTLPGGEVLTMEGTVAHSLRSKSGNSSAQSGLGLRVGATEPRMQTAWARFVTEIGGGQAQSCIPIEADPAAPPRPPVTASVTLQVPLANTDALAALAAQSGDNIRIPASAGLAPGCDVNVILIHPLDGSEFSFSAPVRAEEGTHLVLDVSANPGLWDSVSDFAELQPAQRDVTAGSGHS